MPNADWKGLRLPLWQKGGMPFGVKSLRWVISFLMVILMAQALQAKEKEVLFRESFENLDNWKPIYFPKINKHSVYLVESKDGERTLKAVSDASASALLHKKEFNVYDFPKVRWRWCSFSN